MKKTVLLLLTLLIMLGPAAAPAEKGRGITGREDAAYHERHLEGHIGSDELHGTGNYLKVRAECRMNAKVLGHLEQADSFVLMEVKNGLALVHVTRSDASSPDSWPGLSGWVDLRYLDCPCSPAEYDSLSYFDYEAVLARARLELEEALEDESGDYWQFRDSIFQEPLYAPGNMGYLYRDLNEDGIPELLILSDDWESGGNMVWAVFTVKNGRPYRVLTGWSRSRYTLLEDNTFFHEGSDGASYSVSALYVFDGDRLSYAGGYASSDYTFGGGERWGWFCSPDGGYTTDLSLLVPDAEAEEWSRSLQSRAVHSDEWQALW